MSPAHEGGRSGGNGFDERTAKHEQRSTQGLAELKAAYPGRCDQFERRLRRARGRYRHLQIGEAPSMTRACRELLGEFVDAGIPGLEQRAVEAGQLAAGNPRLAELDAENDAAWYVQDQREETANQVAEQTLRYHLAAWNRAVPVQAAVTAMTDRSTDPILGEAALDAAMRTVEARWQPFAAPPPDEVRTRRAAPASPAP